MIPAPSPSTSGPAPAFVALQPSSSSKPNTTQTVTFICLSIGVFCVCCVALALGVWFIWRRSRREYLSYLRRQAESQAAEGKSEPPVKKQVRLPVVVVQPDDNVEYGRAESRFFPQRSAQPQKDLPQPKLPDTPPKGAYYIEGAPGYFEVDLEVGKPCKTPACTPRASSASFLVSPRSMLNAAITLLGPRVSSSPMTSQEPPQQRDLEDSAHAGGDANPTTRSQSSSSKSTVPYEV